MRIQIRNITVLVLLCVLWACGGGDRALQSALDRADTMMETHPDSALTLLEPYDSTEIRSEEQRARFALLYSMALDKNYKDTANFNVLQPALDYYPTHGTDADKLRTLYYEGRIYENAKRMDKAMEAWAEALQYRGPKTDSLTLARLLVAQGNEYYRLYQFDKYNYNNREAEEIYQALGRKDFADKAFLYQFELSLNRDSAYAKSNIERVGILALDPLSPHAELARSLALQYEMHFGTPESLERRIEEYEGYPVDKLNLAKALIKLGRIDEAESYFHAVNKKEVNPIKYFLTKKSLEKANNNFEGALASSEEVLHSFDIKQSTIIKEGRQFAEERFQWRHTVEKHRRFLKIVSIISVLAIIIIIIIYLTLWHRARVRYIRKEERIKRQISERTAEMMQKISLLESEKASLSELLKKPAELPQAIKERLALLDSLIKDSWSSSLKAPKESNTGFFNKMTEDPDFLVKSGLVLEATYPAEAAALKEKGLTNEELGYLSIYLMGFSGKEIGILLNSKGKYKKSSIIRKKMGLDPQDKNLGAIVKRIFGVSSRGED